MTITPLRTMQGVKDETLIATILSRVKSGELSMEETLVHVINFATEKMWQYPRKSMDIATSKCFLFRGNYFVAIATTPNLRRKSDNPFRRYSHALYKGF